MSRLALVSIALIALVACSDRNPSEQHAAPAEPARVAPRPIAPAATAPIARGSISAGRGHVCVRTSDATAACWGLMSGEMKELVPTPTRVAGPEHVAGVATGDFENCAWTTDGAVWCWGLVGPDRAAHVIPKLVDVIEVTGDSSTMCARDRGGGVTCWSRDVTGEGGAAKPLVLHETPDLHDAVQVAVAARRACARRAGGEVACWDVGDGGKPAAFAAASGAIAIFAGSTKRYSSTPDARFVAVLPRGQLIGWTGAGTAWALPSLPVDVTRIGIGSSEICALGHEVTCWDLEKPGDKPAPRAGLAGAVDLAIGESVSCVRTATGKAMCWGIPDRVGNGMTLLARTPVEVVGVDDAVQLATGAATCARRKTGAVACWGGSLIGDAPALRPVDVPGLTDVVDVAVGDRYACARRASGDVSCWGDRPDHGKGAARWPTPTVLPELARATGLVVLGGDVCATRDGRTICPKHVKLGPLPADVTREWSASIARISWSCVERASQKKIACRRAFAGRHDDSEDVVDTELGDLADVVDLILPRYDTVTYVARKSGDLGYHTEGDGEGEFHAVPVGGKVLSIAAGPGGPDSDGSDGETCGLLASGEIACWTDPDPIKVRKMPGIADAIQLAGSRSSLGFSVLCALRRTGKVACWGTRDMLGDGVGTGPDIVVVNGLVL